MREKFQDITVWTRTTINEFLEKKKRTRKNRICKRREQK